VVKRVAAVLEALADGRPAGVTELAGRVGLRKSSTHRLLAALARAQLVRYDALTRRYNLGFRVLRWTASWLDRLDVRTHALFHLRTLREKCEETVSLNLRDGHRRVAVERLETARELRFVVDLGVPLPLHVGASGKAILAFLPTDEVAEVLSEAKLGPRARAALRRELDGIRRLGSAVSLGERIPGSGSVAAPVFNHEHSVIGSVSILALAVRLSDDVIRSHRELARQAGEAISRALGWEPDLPAGRFQARQRGRRHG
jgi:DNA-binding IclR family transcriptional regulator